MAPKGMKAMKAMKAQKEKDSSSSEEAEGGEGKVMKAMKAMKKSGLGVRNLRANQADNIMGILIEPALICQGPILYVYSLEP